jgi:BRCA1-associated protein
MHHIKQEVSKEVSLVLTTTTTTTTNTHTNGNKKIHHSKTPGEIETIHFFAGNPVVEITEGKIHLYKNEIRDEKDKQVSCFSKCMRVLTFEFLKIKQSELLCVLAVPSYMSPSDFAAFTGSFHKLITNMRILRFLSAMEYVNLTCFRDNSSDTYMVVIKLVSQEAADEFFCEFNGKPFSSMEVGLYSVCCTNDLKA